MVAYCCLLIAPMVAPMVAYCYMGVPFFEVNHVGNHGGKTGICTSSYSFMAVLQCHYGTEITKIPDVG